MWLPIRSWHTLSYPIISIKTIISHHIPSCPDPHHVMSRPILSCHVASCCSVTEQPFEVDQASISQLYLLIYGTRYLPLQFAEPLQSKHIYCNVTCVKKKGTVDEHWSRAARVLSSSALELLSQALPGNPSLRGRWISRQDEGCKAAAE